MEESALVFLIHKGQNSTTFSHFSVEKKVVKKTDYFQINSNLAVNDFLAHGTLYLVAIRGFNHAFFSHDIVNQSSRRNIKDRVPC